MTDESPSTDHTAGDRLGLEGHAASPPSCLILLTLATVLWAFLPNLCLLVAQALMMKNKDKSRIKEGKEGENWLESRGRCAGVGGYATGLISKDKRGAGMSFENIKTPN